MYKPKVINVKNTYLVALITLTSHENFSYSCSKKTYHKQYKHAYYNQPNRILKEKIRLKNKTCKNVQFNN